MIDRTSLHDMQTTPRRSPFFATLQHRNHGSPPVCTTEFEFIKPTSPNASFHKPPDGEDDAIPSPADELFYKGQLLPLSLPSRIKMVEDLGSNERRAAAQVSISTPQFACTKAADPGGNLSLFLRRKRDLRKSYWDSPSPCSSESAEHGKSEERKRQGGDHVISTSWCTDIKRKVKWRMFCCHYTRKSTSQNDAFYLHSVQDDSSSLLNSKRPSPASSSPSSSSPSISFSSSFTLSPSPLSPASSMPLSSLIPSVPRNPSKNSSSHCDRAPTKAMRLVGSKTRAQKASLLGKARYCLQKSFKALKVGPLEQKENHQQQRENLYREVDCESYIQSSAPRHRSQVAHYEHMCKETGNGDVVDGHNDKETVQKSISQAEEGDGHDGGEKSTCHQHKISPQLSKDKGNGHDGGEKPTAHQQNSCPQLSKEGKDMGDKLAICQNLPKENNDWVDDLIKREWSWTTSFDENESFSAAFITIEPYQGFGSPCTGEMRSDLSWMCGNPETTTGIEVEIEGHIQGAIAYCKKSTVEVNMMTVEGEVL